MVRIDLRIDQAKGAPLCIGAGFVALDIVDGEMGSFLSLGGSCGNVMAILAWMGWRSRPVSRLGCDFAGDFVTEELAELGADMQYLVHDKTVSTPVVIQKFVDQANGERLHRFFSLSCPDCGRWLPRFQPVTLRQVAPLIEDDEVPLVLYLDRVTPSSLRLASWAHAAGALIVFEPPSVGNEHEFQRAVDLCDVLKFSTERLGHVPDLAPASHPKLVIETLGPDGLRVRWRGRWSHMPAFDTPAFKDAAGSGDWCTAGMIHRIAQRGSKGFEEMRKLDIEYGLRFGQALAALNCGFEGARGLMSNKSKTQVNRALRALQEKSSPPKTWLETQSPRRLSPDSDCGLCKPLDEVRPKKRISTG